jgi:two-component system, LytTR family, sensor kinase
MILFMLLDDNSSDSEFRVFVVFLIVLLIIVLWKNYKLRSENKFIERKANELANDKIHLENDIKRLKLDISKKRLDPHFFRNSLTKISSYAHTTSESIDKLLPILDYILYESTDEYVALEKEVEFLTNFIDLRKLFLPVDYNIDTIDIKLTPESRNMLIIPNVTTHFIENAFKHGEFTSKDSYIKVKLYTENNFLIFQVNNTIGKSNHNVHGGIGKDSFEERLDNFYPDGIYKLNYSENNGIYTAFLKIPLYAAKT